MSSILYFVFRGSYVANSFIIIINTVCTVNIFTKKGGEEGIFYQIYISGLSEEECNAMSELILIGNADVSSYVSPFSTVK